MLILDTDALHVFGEASCSVPLARGIYGHILLGLGLTWSVRGSLGRREFGQGFGKI